MAFARPRANSGRATILSLALVALAVAAAPAGAASLRGSRASLEKQQRVARQHDYTHLKYRSDVTRFVNNKLLVPIRGGRNYQLAGVSYPYGRPAMKTFIENLGADYRAACGEPLIVTSLVRPKTQQPRNASPLSVHPTGMAVDFRRSSRTSCQRFLDGRLLTLERQGVAEATKENKPPHYHVALFPKQYSKLVADGGLPTGTPTGGKTWRVSRGETLWEIARRVGTSVAAIKRVNGISNAIIRPGQILRIP